jgi:hypothetical protein
MEELFFERLDTVREHRPDLFALVEDVREEYGVFCSFHHGATSEAVNVGVALGIIDANNQWRRMNQAGTSRPALTM